LLPTFYEAGFPVDGRQELSESFYNFFASRLLNFLESEEGLNLAKIWGFGKVFR